MLLQAWLVTSSLIIKQNFKLKIKSKTRVKYGLRIIVFINKPVTFFFLRTLGTFYLL